MNLKDYNKKIRRQNLESKISAFIYLIIIITITYLILK